MTTRDGITWVPLAPLRDPALLLPTVAQALELNEEPGRPPRRDAGRGSRRQADTARARQRRASPSRCGR